MSNTGVKALVDKSHHGFQNYFGTANDVASVGEITDLTLKSATSMSITYQKPQDGTSVFVKIWSGLIIDINKAPIFSQQLNSYSGTVDVNTPALNLLKGAYTVAITSDDNLVIAATQSILNGQNVQAGSSSLFVIAKNLNSINTVFNMPANVSGRQTITWIILYEGNNLGKGNRIATQTITPDSSSGLVQIAFPAGTLKEGQTYNVVLNPGHTTQYITAGYVFQYILQ